MTEHLLPTTVVGSYPQPDWLVDRAMLVDTVPRVRMHKLWRVAEPYLAQAQDDATLLAIRDMERAGIDIVTDGEMRRESYSNRFATALDGIDNDTPGVITNRTRPQRPGAARRRTGSAAAIRSRSPTWRSCGATPAARRRSRCPDRSPWRSRRRTNSTTTPTR